MNEKKSDFRKQVELAISILGSYPDSLDDSDAIKLLLDNGVENENIKDIIQFLPIAFIRNWIPQFKWHDTYLEVVNNKETIERKFNDNESFQIIWQVTKVYFANTPNPDTIFKVGGRSAEFNIINPLLLNGKKLEDITISKIILVR